VGLSFVKILHRNDLLKKVAYKIFAGKPQERRTLAKPRRRWEDNIKTDFKDIGWEGVDWIRLF
jgi:hypothetical protein